MMSKNSIVPFLKDYLIKFLTRPFLLDTNEIERNMNALAPMIELNGMRHTTQSKELTKLVRRDLDRIKDLLNQHSSARVAVYKLKGDKVDSTTLVGFLEMCLKQAESLI